MALDRGLSTAIQSLLAAETVRPVLFVHLEIADDGGEIYAHSAPGFDFDFNPDGVSPAPDWTGAPLFGSVSAISEEAQIDAYTITLTLSGVPASLMSIALSVEYQGRRARFWMACLDDQDRLTETPFLIFEGVVDTMPFTFGDDNQISVTIEDERADFARAIGGRYTHEDQRARYPGDMGLSAVAYMAEATINWGVGVTK